MGPLDVTEDNNNIRYWTLKDEQDKQDLLEEEQLKEQFDWCNN